MQVTRRRLLSTMALGAGAVLLAACGQSASTPAATSAPAKPAESKPAEAAKPAAPAAAGAATSAPAAGATTAPAAAQPAASGGGGPVTISVIAWNSGSSAEAFKNAMAQINDKYKAQKPNVTITFEPLGQGATWTNAQMSRIAGQTTDVTATYGFAPQDIINFQPDSQFIDISGIDSLKNFDQTNVKRFMTWKGKVWQLTLAYVGHLVWVNQDMMDKYKLQAPTTYDEWNKLCDTLKSNKEEPVFYAAKPQTSLSRFASQVELTVGRSKHPNFWTDMLVQGKADFTTPEWIEGFKRAKDFVKNNLDPAFSGIDYPTGAGLFATGKYGMWPEGSFSGGDIMAAKPTFQKLTAFNAPFGDDKDQNAIQPVYGDLGWAGLKYSKNAGVVTDWINFFGQKENFQSFMQVLQYYPTQTDAKLTGPVPEAEAPLLKKTAVSMVRLGLPGMTFDNNWGDLLLSDQYTPETYAQYIQKNWDDSKPQWQKYIGMFDNDWAKLYFG
jgi:ABC-type glycerol-3-phosphate transport system substrate-binding protein